jgi:transglutaminase-like putative cysteine protease
MKNLTLSIRHETLYRYEKPVGYTLQLLRLTPRTEIGQRIQQWQITTQGKRQSSIDAFGNSSDMLTLAFPHQEISIIASGLVEVQAPDRGRMPDNVAISPLAFTVPTRLTEPTETIREFSSRHLSTHANSSQLISLAEAICSEVSYQSGATATESTADVALALGKGVCQDHSHLFIACCHTLGIPARYVSGYIDPGDVEHSASHAWIDVWVEETNYAGWISIDVTHACLQSARYCRLAVGRDYESAAPIRGIRRGGGTESMSVNVKVRDIWR